MASCARWNFWNSECCECQGWFSAKKMLSWRTGTISTDFNGALVESGQGLRKDLFWTKYARDPCMVEIKGFFVDYRRFPFAGVARGHYPLSIAFDGRLTEQKILSRLPQVSIRRRAWGSVSIQQGMRWFPDWVESPKPKMRQWRLRRKQ